jgi:hypothetical protein
LIALAGLGWPERVNKTFVLKIERDGSRFNSSDTIIAFFWVAIRKSK